jgi:anti-repressor protein
MKELLNTMSSREIAELTEKKHRHVTRDIEKLNESYEKMGLPKIGQTPYVHKQNGETYYEYLLTKTQCYDLLTGYNVVLRIKIIRRWEELEKAQIPDFNNPAIAARAWADEYEKRVKVEKEAQIMKPKAEFYDKVTDSTDTMDIGTVAKLLKIGPYKLFKFLREKKILMSGNRHNEPYQQYIDQGYFKTIETAYPKGDTGETGVSTKTLVYQRGLDYISKIYQEVK